ncbi:hypothetical protein [Actinomadura nitritigenes]|uniref:hypothetical protein n=1 Tax=Actinomadura nitritigenes TaxID=134602 RepID=UPI003D8A39E1
MSAEPELPEGIVRAGEPIGIGNEFTGVRVRKVWTRQGERLEILVPKHGHRILLDAMQLEIIARQDPERFTQLFAVALGSEDAPEGGRDPGAGDGPGGEEAGRR